MSGHTFPPKDWFAQASQQDSAVKGYRSFINLSKCKAFCIFEASDKESAAIWFRKTGIPYDNITQLEIEGETWYYRRGMNVKGD